LSADAKSAAKRAAFSILALTVRQHLPESAQRSPLASAAKRRQITLQVSLDKCQPPVEASGIVWREVAIRKSAANPQPVCGSVLLGPINLADQKRRQLQIRDPARETFGGLLQQID